MTCLAIYGPSAPLPGSKTESRGLVGFTRTYFEMYFTEQYQKASFEMDSVMNIRFPRAFAAGKKEYQGRTYHFYTKESLEALENSPSQHVEAR